MPAADLPSLETRLEACLIELERLHQVRPSLPDALGRAGAGQRIDGANEVPERLLASVLRAVERAVEQP